MMLFYLLILLIRPVEYPTTKPEMRIIDTLKNEIPLLQPLQEKEFKYVSSDFGWRVDPHTGIDSTFHPGVDIAPLVKDAQVFATASGVVKLVNRRISNSDYGKYILIKHKYGFETFYAHLQRVYVKKDELVKAGQLIGVVGSTGKSTADHLHYEIIYEGVQIDPLFIHELNH